MTLFQSGLLAFSIFLITYLTGYSVIYRTYQSSATSIQTLATGIFFGAALFHMLPDAIHAFDALTKLAVIWTLSCCVLTMLLMRLLSRLLQQCQQSLTPALLSGFIIAIMLGIHSLLEGLTLGLSQVFSVAIIVFLAIMSHKAAASFALAAQLRYSHYPARRSHRMILIFSLLTPVGVMIGNLYQHQASIHSASWLSAIFLAAAAGTFLYIALIENLLTWFTGTNSTATIKPRILLCTSGMLFMLILTYWV